MSSSAVTFPARFAELVYLLAHQPDAAAEHERVLSEAMAAIATGSASLVTGQLNVDLLDEGQSADGVRLHELVMRMSAHSAHQIHFPATGSREDVLGVARPGVNFSTPIDAIEAFTTVASTFLIVPPPALQTVFMQAFQAIRVRDNSADAA